MTSRRRGALAGMMAAGALGVAVAGLSHCGHFPLLSVAPPGFAFPDGESAQVVEFNDEEHGFLRITLDLKHRVLLGEYFVAYSAASGSIPPALRDSFTLDLKRHRIS